MMRQSWSKVKKMPLGGTVVLFCVFVFPSMPKRPRPNRSWNCKLEGQDVHPEKWSSSGLHFWREGWDWGQAVQYPDTAISKAAELSPPSCIYLPRKGIDPVSCLWYTCICGQDRYQHTHRQTYLQVHVHTHTHTRTYRYVYTYFDNFFYLYFAYIHIYIHILLSLIFDSSLIGRS